MHAGIPLVFIRVSSSRFAGHLRVSLSIDPVFKAPRAEERPIAGAPIVSASGRIVRSGGRKAGLKPTLFFLQSPASGAFVEVA